MRRAAAAAPALALLLVLSATGQAHKGITSKFTYNADVYPVFLKRCGRCHIDGGVGPMSLLKYEDAFPWAESLRAELLSAYPDAASESAGATNDPHDFVKAAHRQISARELDIILDWATGGTPEGDTANTPSPPAYTNEWAAGTPAVSVAMPAAYEIPASAFEATQEFVLPVPLSAPRLASQFDLLPGTPAIVRRATVVLRSLDGTTRTLGTWFPRQAPAPLALKPAALVEPGSQLLVRILYKKNWKLEGQAVTDRSTIGLYFSD
jgi:hypothetical protein